MKEKAQKGMIFSIFLLFEYLKANKGVSSGQKSSKSEQI